MNNKKVKPNRPTETKMDGEEFLSDMPKKSAAKRVKIVSKNIDGEKFLSNKEKKIKSFEAFSVPQRPEQGDKYQQLDTEDHSANPGTDIPTQEPISRPKNGDTYQNLQDKKVANKATSKIKNARPEQGNKYQKLSTGKMKSFESFINEEYMDEMNDMDDETYFADKIANRVPAVEGNTYIEVSDGIIKLTTDKESAMHFETHEEASEFAQNFQIFDYELEDVEVWPYDDNFIVIKSNNIDDAINPAEENDREDRIEDLLGKDWDNTEN
jgi:hypothetical protein